MLSSQSVLLVWRRDMGSVSAYMVTTITREKSRVRLLQEVGEVFR